jgi:hypothetical protein
LCSQCLSKTDKELKGCEKIADAIKKGDSRDRAESDPQLPAPLVTIAFRPTPCLSEQVPAPSTPNYLKYGMASRPDGVPGAENERVGQIIAAMNEGYNSFNNAIESAYCRKNSGEKCVEGSVEKRISHFAEVCRNRVLHNLGLIENFSPRPSNKGQNKKSDIEDAFPTGRKLVEDLKAAMRDAESFRVELEKQRKALDDAIKKYNANASTLGIAQKKKKEGEEDKEELKETLEDIRKAIDAANGIGGAVGIEIASEQQLKAIDGLIEAIAEGQVDAAKFGDNEKLKRFATVASTIRSLQKQFDEASVKQAELQLSVLLTQRRIQEARRNWARKRVEIQQKRIELYSSRLTTLAGREAKKSEPRSVLAFYESAFTRLNRAVLGDNHGGFDLVKDQESADKNKWESESRSIQAILGEMRTASVSEDQADDLAQGLVDLATANQVLKSNAETVAIKLEMLKGQEVLAKNEMSLMMWDAIIRQPLVLVAAYHQAGVKPEELAKLFILASGFISVGGTN